MFRKQRQKEFKMRQHNILTQTAREERDLRWKDAGLRRAQEEERRREVCVCVRGVEGGGVCWCFFLSRKRKSADVRFVCEREVVREGACVGVCECERLRISCEREYFHMYLETRPLFLPLT